MDWSKQATILGPPGPAPSGTGLVKTAAGTLVDPAALLVNADVAGAAAIAESKLALASDAAAATASRRTLGTGATQACAGNDVRLAVTLPVKATEAEVVAASDDAKFATPLSLAALSHKNLAIGVGGLASGTIPLLYVIGVGANTAGNYDSPVLSAGFVVFDVWCLKTSANAATGDTVKLQRVTSPSTAGDITNAMQLGADKTIVRTSTIDDGYWSMPTSSSYFLRVVAEKVTDCRCAVFILGYRLA